MHELVIVIAKYFVVIPLAVYLAALIVAERRTRLRLIAVGLAAGAITLVLVKIATTVHQDPRPFVRDGVRPYFASSTDNGFPSDHTAFSALFGFVLLTRYRALGLAVLVVAIAIGTCRVIAGVHHGQDIAGGFVIAGIGVAASEVLARTCGPAAKRMVSRKNQS